MKHRILLVLVLTLVLLCAPGVALADFDEYGFNFEGKVFKGSIENWDAYISYIYGWTEELAPASPVDWQAQDVWFAHKKWDKKFAAGMFEKPPYEEPWQEGAWMKINAWNNLSGDMAGYIEHERGTMVFSTQPIEGAWSFPEYPYPDNYLQITEYEWWLTDPDGNVVDSFTGPDVNRGVIVKMLHKKAK